MRQKCELMSFSDQGKIHFNPAGLTLLFMQTMMSHHDVGHSPGGEGAKIDLKWFETTVYATITEQILGILKQKITKSTTKLCHTPLLAGFGQ